MSRTADIALPLISHLNFVAYTLNTRKGLISEAFKTRLNDFDFPAGEIFFHGIHALHRAVELMRNPELKFHSIDMSRIPNLEASDELLKLYEQTVSAFTDELSKMEDEELDKKIPSPLNGRPITQKEWFAQSIMHTIHHVGQAVRIQGMVYRKLTDTPADYSTASDYTPLYGV